MATVSVVKLKIRRGSDYERKQITLDVGEIGYTTDASSRRLFVGDGSTRGGNPVGTKLLFGSFISPDPSLTTAQVGDIVFNQDNNQLYALTGVNLQNFPNYAVATAYAPLTVRPDNQTIEYDNNGYLKVKTNSIGAEQVNDSVVDFTNGFTRVGQGPIQINYDDITIKIVDGSLTVNQAAIQLGQINTKDQTIDASNIGLQDVPGVAWPSGSRKIWRDSNGYLRCS